MQRNIAGETETDYYVLSDLLYRATALINASAAIQETYDCDAYGNTIAYDSAESGGWFSGDETATNNPKCQFIFTGRRFDPETSNATTQMYFYRARYYSPVLGRFISRDPIGYNGGMNLYEYVGGMAMDVVDPSGFFLGRAATWLFGGRGRERMEANEKQARNQAKWLRRRIKKSERDAEKAMAQGCLGEAKEHMARAKRHLNTLYGVLEDARNIRKDFWNAAEKGANEGLDIGMAILEKNFKLRMDAEANARADALMKRYRLEYLDYVAGAGAVSLYAAGGIAAIEYASGATVAGGIQAAPGALTIGGGTSGFMTVSEAGTILGAAYTAGVENAVGTAALITVEVVVPVARWTVNTPPGQYALGFGQGVYSGYTSQSVGPPMTSLQAAGQRHGEFVGTLIGSR